jgi:HPt (histidine-containing phosphotransfer) domain-containing protein
MTEREDSGAAAKANLNQVLDQLWVRFLPEIEERVSVLAAAVASLQQGKLDATEREAAHAAAHKLAGVLGTFGLARGTELARELEVAFESGSVIDRGTGLRLSGLVAEVRALIAGRKGALSSDDL